MILGKSTACHILMRNKSRRAKVERRYAQIALSPPRPDSTYTRCRSGTTRPNFGDRSTATPAQFNLDAAPPIPAPRRRLPTPISRAALPNETPNALPLREIALFSSGVGYFGRAGRINGETSVPLTVHAPQIADLLKSLVLLDPKGAVKPVTYGLGDYLSRRQSETDLNLSAASSPGALLQAFQGAVVRIEKPAGAVEGRILSVNSRQIKEGERLLSVENLSLLTNLGVQTVRLDDVTSFRLLDADLDAKLRATLEQKAANLTSQLDDGARSVTLHFGGKGAREVRAGCLLETPAWKTSCRLVLDEKKKPYLQGWAIVENTPDDNRNAVKLSLISGRPISFIQDLAAPTLEISFPPSSLSRFSRPRITPGSTAARLWRFSPFQSAPRP